jgi:hypothetical protein
MTKIEDLITWDSISERDMDLLFLEEAQVNEAFSQWLAQQIFGAGARFSTAVRAWHSITDSRLGESDLIVIYRDPSGRRVAILIENKVSAGAQPEQAQRYKQRGLTGVQENEWDDFKTCIVAPRAYLDAQPDTQGYDAGITYEAIADWLETSAQDSLRAKYRSAFVRAAVTQARRGYVPKNDPRMAEFWRAYKEDVNELFPELEFLPKPGPRPATSTWIVFTPQSLSKLRSINHKFEAGVVDLATEYPVDQYEVVTRILLPVLDPIDMKVAKTGRSVAIRVRVPPLKGLEDYNTQRELARAGMRAAYRLLYLSPALPARTAADG